MDNTLTFTTASFKAETASVLHSGVYSKEFSSMLLASGLCVLVYMYADVTDSTVIRSAIFILLFIRKLIMSSIFLKNTKLLLIHEKLKLGK